MLTEGEAKTTHGGFRFVKGELVQRVEYTPFGKERFVLNSALEELPKYTGQTDDIETDLYYYGSRYYDSVLGRFIQPDSIIPDAYSSQSLNGYAYVLGNPLRYVDPAGYVPLLPIGVVPLVPEDGSYDFKIPSFVPGVGGYDVSVSASVSLGIYNLSTTGENNVLAPASLGVGIDFSVTNPSSVDVEMGSVQYGIGENLGVGLLFAEEDGTVKINGITGGIGASIGSVVQASASYDYLEQLASNSTQEEGTVVVQSLPDISNAQDDSLANIIDQQIESTIIGNSGNMSGGRQREE